MHSAALVNLALYPPWDSKMNIGLGAEY